MGLDLISHLIISGQPSLEVRRDARPVSSAGVTSTGEWSQPQSRDLADLLRMGRLPDSWIAQPGTRKLRELVRHRGYQAVQTIPGIWPTLAAVLVAEIGA